MALYGWLARRLLIFATRLGWLNTPPSFRPSLEIHRPNGASPGSNSGDDPGSNGGGRFFPVRRSSAVFLNVYDQISSFLGAPSRPVAPGYQPPRLRVSSPSAITGVNRTGPGPA